jgi:hypothetical protein
MLKYALYFINAGIILSIKALYTMAEYPHASYEKRKARRVRRENWRIGESRIDSTLVLV